MFYPPLISDRTHAETYQIVTAVPCLLSSASRTLQYYRCLSNYSNAFYSLCMKFRAELVNFQDQFENRVLCKTFSYRQNSEVQPSVNKFEELNIAFE